jgi:hypothetical protein
MNGHIDADRLAEYRIGLITGRRGRDIAAHLATCAECAVTSDRLAEVSVLLAAAPLPAIPDVVAARLQAAMDAEIPRSTKQAGSSERTVVPSTRPRFRLPRLSPIRVLAPAAAAVVLAAGGYGLSLLTGGTPPVASSASAGPAAAPSPMEGSFGPQHHLNDGLSIRAGAGRLPVVVSGTDFQAARLGQQLGAFFQASFGSQATLASASLKACVRAVAADRPVELVVSAHYVGAPATVVIVNQGAGYQALVAGSHCSPTDSDIVARAVLPSGISKP